MIYEYDREWSDRFIPAIRRIVGPNLLVPSDYQRDAKQATDLVVLKARVEARVLDVAARVRAPGYGIRYPWEFTIRSHRESGAVTELEKILTGFANWMFYGHADVDQRSIARGFLIDLDCFRSWVRSGAPGMRTGEKSNRDGTYFRWFDLSTLPPGWRHMVIDRSHPIPFVERVH
jgi:hypothetical protein